MKTMHLATTALLALGLSACASITDSRGDRYEDGSYYSAPRAGQGDYYYAPEPSPYPYYYDPFFYDDPFFFGSSFGQSCWPSDFGCYSPWLWHPELHRHPQRVRAPAPSDGTASSFPDDDATAFPPPRVERAAPRLQRAPMFDRPVAPPIRRSRRQSD